MSESEGGREHTREDGSDIRCPLSAALRKEEG